MRSRKSSLRLARQIRTCPPPDIVHDPEYTEQMNHHYQICPYCHPGSGQTSDPWARFLDAMDRAAPPPAPARNTPPLPGQWRAVRPELAAFRGGFFYTPPLVLVVDAPRAISDDLTVVQTWMDAALAGPGDLILSPEQAGLEAVFIETWNHYTLRAAFLGPRLGCVSDSVLSAVKRMMADPGHPPDWAPVPLPLTDDDPRHAFRRIEVEVGYTFASRSAAELVAQLRKKPLPARLATAEKMTAALNKRLADLTWSFTPSDALTALAAARWPEEYYAKAAADRGDDWVWANLIHLDQGRIVLFEPVRVNIVMREPIPEGLGIVGEIQDLPPGEGDPEIHCYLILENGQIAPAESVAWMRPARRFIGSFITQNPERARLAVALIRGA